MPNPVPDPLPTTAPGSRSAPEPAAVRPTVGIFGLFDLASLDHQLRLRVVAAELARRGVAVRAFAPFGATRPVPLDGGEPVEPLFPGDASTVGSLGEALDAVLLCADPGPTGPVDLAVLYGEPAAALVAPARLLEEGLPGVPTVRLPAEPHPAVLAARAFPAALLDLRLPYLRALGWWPDGNAVVMEAGRSPGDIGEQSGVVFVGADPASDREAVEAARQHGGRALPEAASVEDRVAAVAHAARVAATSPVLRALALAYGKAPVGPIPAEPGDAVDPAAAAAVLDAAFDAVVGLAAEGEIPAPASEVVALRAALDARGQRLATERQVLADYVRALQSNAARQVAAAREAAEHLRAENEALRHPLRRAGRAAARLWRRGGGP